MKTRLINILRNRKTLTEKFYKKIQVVPSFRPLLKKFKMYMNGDRRLSIDKLINDLKNVNIQKGSGTDSITKYTISIKKPEEYKFEYVGLGAGYDFSFLNPGEDDIHQIEDPISKIPPGQNSSTTNICKEPQTEHIVLGESFAHGGFAKIYDVRNDPSKVCKLFFEQDTKLMEKIQNNFTRFNSLLKTSEKKEITLSVPPENDWVCIDNLFGYLMTKMNGGSLLDVVKKLNNSESVLDVVTFITQARNKLPDITELKFIHGDIKLENILIHNGAAYLHDFDGVCVYEPPPIETPIEIYHTPLYAHPLLTFAIDYLSNKKESNINKENAMFCFELHMNLALHGNTSTSNTLYRTAITSIINEKWPSNKSFTISQYYKKFDLYALGASLLHTGIYKQIEPMQKLGKQYIEEALTPESSSGGGTLGIQGKHITPSTHGRPGLQNVTLGQRNVTPGQRNVTRRLPPVTHGLQNVTYGPQSVTPVRVGPLSRELNAYEFPPIIINKYEEEAFDRASRFKIRYIAKS